jgi:hypothetical protein
MIKSHLLYQLSYKGCCGLQFNRAEPTFGRFLHVKLVTLNTLSAPKSLASPTNERLSYNFFLFIAIFSNPLLTKLWEIADTLGKL